MIPDFQSLLRPVLEKASQGEVRMSDVVEEIADDLGLSDEERAELIPSGKAKRFSNRVHWARFHLKEAGLLESRERGYVTITSAGRELLAKSPPRITLSLLKALKADAPINAVTQVESDISASGDAKTPDEVFREAFEEVQVALKRDLLERLMGNDPDFFEGSVVKLLQAMGYGAEQSTGRVLGRSGDDGVDGVINQDALGVDQLYVQAKRYKAGNNVSSGAIRDFFGALALKDVTKGIFITTSDFSESARATAAKLNARIVLINGNELSELMLKHHVGCRVVETYEALAIDEEFFR